MIIVKESKRVVEGYPIRGKGSKDMAVLAILANSKATIKESDILQVKRFFDILFE